MAVCCYQLQKPKTMLEKGWWLFDIEQMEDESFKRGGEDRKVLYDRTAVKGFPGTQMLVVVWKQACVELQVER